MVDEDEQLPEIRDACEVCNGRNGGVPGNENVINGIVTCDYCHADDIARVDRSRARTVNRITDCCYIGANDEYHGMKGIVKVFLDGHAEAKFRDEFKRIDLSEIEISRPPDPIWGRAVYVGPLDDMKGLTALAKQYLDCIEVQIDKFEHPMSHGWHTFLSSNWEFTPDDRHPDTNDTDAANRRVGMADQQS